MQLGQVSNCHIHWFSTPPQSKGQYLVDRTGHGPFAETRALVAGLQIREVKGMGRRRYPMPGDMSSGRPWEAADPAEFVTALELADLRIGDRGKLGVA
jgi:hypothetical protein